VLNPKIIKNWVIGQSGDCAIKNQNSLSLQRLRAILALIFNYKIIRLHNCEIVLWFS
jgi:hypothetical protein